jgi:hypothetical protein
MRAVATPVRPHEHLTHLDHHRKPTKPSFPLLNRATAREIGS